MSYTLIRETFPVARKKHRCIWCGEFILIGEKYRHEISKYDDIQNHHWHLECDADAAREFRENPYDCEFLPFSNERPASLPLTHPGPI